LRYARRCAAAIFLLVSTSVLAAEPDAEEIRNAAKEVAKNLGVQSKLPNDSGLTDAETRRARPRRGGFGGDGIYLPGADIVVGLMQWALVVVAAITILAVLAILIREPLQARFKPSVSPPVPLEGDPAPPPDPRELLARADRLAAQGQFAEAMHCVLLAAMIVIGGDADSQTSWELLRHCKLPAGQLNTLRDLVIRVERAWFGQRPAGADDYRYVRGIFDAFQRPAAETA